MAEGQLRCAGSSLFLKKKYGVGYQLTIEKARSGGGSKTMQEKSLEDGDTDVESNYPPTNGNGDVHKSVDLEELVESAVPEATLLNNVGTEVRYQLPLGAASKFPALFQRLDDETDIVSSYGVSMTTLGTNTFHVWLGLFVWSYRQLQSANFSYLLPGNKNRRGFSVGSAR